MIKTLRPRSYDEAIYIGHYFREGFAVVLDLTGLAPDDARSFVDFASGLVIGREGAMERVTPGVFVLHPPAGRTPTGTARPAVTSA
ncbi:cell division protein SepF [Micromonospora fluostatini]|uniref:cell division protein SepF n=1 Tax=Micromonospora sp. JCM 30529 TaxID=3421643 RepID=UPI003D16FE50